MTILNYVLLTIMFCVIPAGVLWLCRRFTLLGKIGPIMILYAVGLVIGNIPMPDEIKTFQDILPNIMVPLAIPMMLFGCTFKLSEAKLQLKVVTSGVISVSVATVGGYLLFGRDLPNGPEIGGMIAGKCTGGTLNMAALQVMLGVDNETYIMLNSYDIIICFLYFVFLLSVGIKMFRRLYREKRSSELSAEDQAEIERQVALTKVNPYKGIFSKEGWMQIGKTLLATLIIVAISAGIAHLTAPEGWFTVVFILMLTTLGIVGTFLKPVRALTRSYDIGMYLIYIFSLVIASMADLSELNIAGGLYQIGFMSFAIFVSLAIHALICRLMKVDADSMVISSVAFINSPPFVPMISAAMRNKNTLVTGLSAGLIGYAVGNYLGFIMKELLSIL
ncbi:MAG: DUF819 family protein [Rikenellaceae bacterium]|nr:DUF819 family protein [Rikenellaceae bacterium]